MITFFSIPREFKGIHKSIQDYCIRSWVSSVPDSEVILLGEGKEQAEAYSYIRNYPVECNERGTPFIDHAFFLAQEHATHDILCYVNTDIYFVGGVKETAHCTLHRLHPSSLFLITGRRFDVRKEYVPMAITYPFSSPPLSSLDEKYGEYHCRHGEDYFIFPKGLYSNVPPFLVGRSAWDNWLVMDANDRKVNTIDATHTILALHLGFTKLHHDKTKEYEYNQRIWKENGGRNGAGWVDSVLFIAYRKDNKVYLCRR